MYVYCGKITWLQQAENECITFVFPAGLALKDPVCAYWQWSDQAKTNNHQYGTINTVDKTDVAYKISFVCTDYLFDAEFTSNLRSMTIKMYTASQPVPSVSTLTLYTTSLTLVPSTKVYTGKFNWWTHATNEMMTLVLPNGISAGAPVGLYFQFTVNWKNLPKTLYCVNSTFHTVQISAGQIKASFNSAYYMFDAIIYPGTKNAKVTMRENQMDRSFDLVQNDWRQAHRKKALIVRYGTGTDNGISLLRETLTTDLGFDAGDVEMLYYNSEPANASAVVSDRQEAPTAARFKSKLTSFLSSAGADDVRLLYLDTRGAVNPDGGSTNSADEETGLVLAANEQGTETEIVYSDWLATTIRENLTGGVNLTILTSSCLGREMMSTTTATGGILLSACHETQSNIKALQVGSNKVDPWMYAIVAVIKKQLKEKRGVPTYSSLFNSAKKFIKSQLGQPSLDADKYKGPSTNELSPTKRDLGTSHQDPQLIFIDGYVNPHEERFLFPFVAPRGGHAGEGVVRFPRDEYPTHWIL
ncbi:uncharacterized protein SCHCODRAFT_02668077 [Schizophyllum commune H4-8]|nr:uncharacterized protein SCHCODRAFT_02668077 [Schizophyllum commune H4-8]KAI5892649.1 hypothetical protein SCHCODRAFT_02668077 [Schizophyllum commune H4-8]